VASLQLDPLSGRFRIRFSFGEQEYKRSLKTQVESVARATLGRVEETIRLMEQGRIEIPANVDIGKFILSDGKRHGKIVVQRVLNLNDVIARYQEALPNGAKEANTITTEKLHCKHFRRILTEQIAMQALGTADLQRYAEKRSQEKGRRGNVRPRRRLQAVCDLRWQAMDALVQRSQGRRRANRAGVA